MKIKKGQLIAMTNGEYSDYCLRDHVKAMRDFDSKEEVERFKETGDYATEQWGDISTMGSDERFIAWAIREKLIKPLSTGKVIEWHYGSWYQVEDIE